MEKHTRKEMNHHANINMNHHTTINLTVDVIIFAKRDTKLHVLLVERKYDPFKGQWAFPGGFVEVGERLEQAALRELEEETGVSGVAIKQLHTFGDPGRDPRGHTVSVVYYCLLEDDCPEIRAGDDASQAEWFDVAEVPQLAFDHQKILDYALQCVD